MDINIASHQIHLYNVATPLYEGPLDLLLQLIERAELDITRLALAQVTDQYLAYLGDLQDHPADEVSAFLVIASKLLQIKSEALLPRPPVRDEGEEDPGEALEQQLITYKRFKTIAEYLARRDEAGLHAYLRLSPPPKVEGVVDLSSITLQDLIAAAHEALVKIESKPALRTVVTAPSVTIRQKIQSIALALKSRQRTTLLNLLKESATRLDVVVTFLAILELVKRRMIQVQQDTLFGDIELQPSETWDASADFELEFGE
jgi:segregation and condensation protein A